MGYKLIGQFTLIIAALVILFAFVQPSLLSIKVKQDKLFQYNEAIAKAAEFNARLRELIAIRDSFSSSNLRDLERFVPTSIDQLRRMSEISGIFSSRGIIVTSLLAREVVDPMTDVAFESGVVTESFLTSNLSYQDFEVTFTGTYEQMKDVLMLAEASDSLLEVGELSFNAAPTAADVDREGNAVTQTGPGTHSYKIIFRTYGLPIETNI
jgi:hypothetical protein